MTYNAPPGMGQQKKGTNPLVWVFVALGAFCCIAIIAFGAMTMTVMNQTKNLMPCMFTMSTLGASMSEYVKEKGTYPKADTWQDDLATYYEARSKDFAEEFKDAPGPLKDWGNIADINSNLNCNDSSPATFIAYNPELSGKKQADITDQKTVMFFETTTNGRNINEEYVRRDFKNAPKMMGSPRGWYQMTVDGNMLIIDEKGKESSVDIRTR